MTYDYILSLNIIDTLTPAEAVALVPLVPRMTFPDRFFVLFQVPQILRPWLSTPSLRRLCATAVVLIMLCRIWPGTQSFSKCRVSA